MTLLAPAWLLLALALGLAVLALHVRRRRTVEVASIQLWRLLERASARRRPLRPPPPTLVMLLQLAAILLAALALAQPLLGEAAPRHRIFVLDASGSMRATDVRPSRFEAALARIGTPSENERVSVIVAGPRPRIVAARLTGRPELDGLAASDGPADWRRAAELVGDLTVVGEDTSVTVLTDGSEAVDLDGARLVFASAAPRNIGLAAAIAPIDSDRWRVSGTIVGAAEPTTVTVFFQPAGSDRFLDWTSVEAAGDFELELDLPGAGLLALRLPADDGPHDDAAYFVVGAPSARELLYLGPGNPPLVQALRAAEGVALFEADALPEDSARFDLVVVDDIVVERHPGTNTLWLGAGRLAGEPAPAPLVDADPDGWRDDHALAQGLRWSAVAPADAFAVPRLPGAEVLLAADGAPLVQARTTQAGREIRIAFGLAGMVWTEQTGFPVFVGNLLRWLGPSDDQSCAVGAPCPVDARLLGARILRDGIEVQRGFAVDGWLPPGLDERFVPERAGFYRIEGGGVVAVNAPAGTESSLEPVAVENTVAQPPPRAIWWWLLAAVLLVLAVEGWLAGRGPERFLRRSGLGRGNPLAGRRRLLLGLRLATLLLATAALLELPLPMLERERNALVVAGGAGNVGLDARVLADLGEAAEPTLPDRADLEGALIMAAAMQPGRIVLAADGSETRGNLGQALGELHRQGLAVDIVPLIHRPSPDAAVTTVSLPAPLFAGDSFVLQAVIESDRATPARLQVLADGVVVAEQAIALEPGANRIEAPVAEAAAGQRLYEVAIAAAGDAVPENDRNGAVAEIAASPRVAIITPEADWGGLLADALAVQGLDATVIPPNRVPWYLKDWLAFDAFVLMNLPAIDLDSRQQELLVQAVEEHGRGLLLLGGENSFGPGGYWQTALERLSPLSSRVPREAPRVAIVFVLDRSGSMRQQVGEVSRLDVAKSATASAVELLHAESLVGVVVFDSEATVLVPLTEAGAPAAFTEALRRLEPGGGTSIHPGLVAALGLLEGVDAPARHIVLMSDGLSEPGDFPGVMAQITQADISVSTVAIGDGADELRLEAMARLGGGASHATRDFNALPSILSQEALLLSSTPVELRPAVPQWVDRDAAFLAGAPAAWPELAGYVLTTAKPEATLHAVVPDATGEPVPLLASWRYGNGRVLAMATHGAGAWTSAWLDQAGYPLLFAQALRQFLPETSPGLAIALARRGDEVGVTIDAEAPPTASVGGRPLALTESAPGRWQGRFIAEAPGDWKVEALAGEARAGAVLHVAYPARDDPGRASLDRLAAIASLTGGRVLAEGEAPPAGALGWAMRPGWRWFALVALALLMFDLTVRYAPGVLQVRRWKA